jgi:NADH dehydrogenase
MSMTDPARPFSPQIVTVFGGAGFLGRYVVNALAKRNYRVRIAVRRPHVAGPAKNFGMVGHVHAVQANLRYPESVLHAARGAEAVVNLVGILQPRSAQTFEAVHVEGARTVAEAAAAAGVRVIHVSAIGADLASASAYARSKAEGEIAVRRAQEDAIVFRPSLMFGPADSFFNRFAALSRMLPVLPLAGADTRFQPVFAGDVAAAIARAVDGTVPAGRTYELGGPAIRTLRELIDYMLQVTERRRLILSLPPGLARTQATLMEALDFVLLGLVPNNFKLTRDQVTLLQRDNVVSEAALREGRTLQGIGIAPTAFEAVVPSYLKRFRKRGQFDGDRGAALESSAPDVIAPESAGAGSQFQPGRGAGPAIGKSPR